MNGGVVLWIYARERLMQTYAHGWHIRLFPASYGIMSADGSTSAGGTSPAAVKAQSLNGRIDFSAPGVITNSAAFSCGAMSGSGSIGSFTITAGFNFTPIFYWNLEQPITYSHGDQIRFEVDQLRFHLT